MTASTWDVAGNETSGPTAKHRASTMCVHLCLSVLVVCGCWTCTDYYVEYPEGLVAVGCPGPAPSLPNLSGRKRSQYIKQEKTPGSIEKKNTGEESVARVRHTTYLQAVLLDSFFFFFFNYCLSAFCCFLLSWSDETNQVQCEGMFISDMFNSAWLLELSFTFLFLLLFIFPTRRGANCISLIVCRCLGTCVFGQVPLLPRHEMWGNRTARSLHWPRMGDPGVTCTLCTLRTLLAVQLGNAWLFLSRGWGSKGSSKSQIIPLDHASKHTPWLDTCLLCFSRGELLHFFLSATDPCTWLSYEHHDLCTDHWSRSALSLLLPHASPLQGRWDVCVGVSARWPCSSGFGRHVLPSSRVPFFMGYLLPSSGTALNAFVAGTQG